MAAFVLAVFIVVLAVEDSVQWSGNICPYTKVIYKSSYICISSCWWTCCAHALIHVPLYTTAYKCCPGWAENGDGNCNIALCYPPCANGGTCSSPGRCSCKDGYTGATCTGHDCNTERPCYPGDCQENGASVVCNCMDDFDGEFCIHLKKTQVPEVTQIQAQFSYIEDGKHIYSLIADGTEQAEQVIVWTNQERLNNINVTASAIFKGRALPHPPFYIIEAKTGIARAFVKMNLVNVEV
ncbi:protocadherin Fat 3-like [Haliotis rubra]|uniref:protocadherin Fat 3-like n=1 Tax=Haliotis rubra TaxID=36100 RepID=UPI001EE58CCA|nr:protocadherin Fat 3-like [Haliotis rubra]